MAVLAVVSFGVKRTTVSGSRSGASPATCAEAKVQVAATRVLTADCAGERETSTSSW
ncbi:hypothetical protein ACRJ4B_18905 [Streptomyces sp. GTA36]